LSRQPAAFAPGDSIIGNWDSFWIRLCLDGRERGN
jgi:hypothetical protein